MIVAMRNCFSCLLRRSVEARRLIRPVLFREGYP
uniref:UDP-glucuronate 4-epimerase 5-like n=1 Tax=Rhizophora mucronata TaxID=61149 RepID=A0A2P2IHR1_RHIMU